MIKSELIKQKSISSASNAYNLKPTSYSKAFTHTSPRLCRVKVTLSAFTIVELLVVIVVIGILAAITIVSYTGLSSKANVSSLQSDLSSAKKQLALYQVEHSAFPTSPLTVNGNSYCPSDDPKYCFKTSTGNTFTYSPASGTTPQAFSLIAKNNNTYYNLTNNSQPTAVTPIPEASVSATGTYTLSSDGPYRIYKFTGNGSITTTTPGTAEVLVVGGGGGGSGGPGGAGGYLTGVESLTGTLNVTVGAGGAGTVSSVVIGSNGGDSIFSTRTAKGGGGGGVYNIHQNGENGGSGGGSSGVTGSIAYGGIASPIGQGNDGGTTGGYNVPPYPGGGGGGVGSVGGNASDTTHAGNGGAGINNDIVQRGILVGYSGGGGGSYGNAGGVQTTASHGGGVGSTTGNGVSGTSNTGGGGGGALYTNTGGSGGSGIVVIRYLTP